MEDSNSDGLKILSDREVGLNHELVVPAEFATHSALKEVLDTGLRKDFEGYYSSQVERITAEGKKVRMSEQQAFEREVEFFCKVVDNVSQTADEQPGRHTVVFFDVDETFGRVSYTHKLFDDFDDTDVQLTPEQIMARNLKDSYDRLVIRPSFVHAVNYLKRKYGNDIDFGVLTTKLQVGLNKYLAPELAVLCPDAFRPELIMSSKDGKAEKYIPDVLEKIKISTLGRRKLLDEKADILRQKQETEHRGQLPVFEVDELLKKQAEIDNYKAVTFREAVTGFFDDTVIENRVIDPASDSYDEALTDYDPKLLMLIRMLQESRHEGTKTLHDHYLFELDDDDLSSMIPPETAIMLFDDAEQPLARPHDSSLRYIQVKPKYLLPDDE